MIWDKLYIMQRERCDWPDVLNLLWACGPDLKWEYLLDRIGEDTPLIAGALGVFRWLAPKRARKLPGWLWQRLGLEPVPAQSSGGRPYHKRRVDLLDRRPWFVPDRVELEPAA
jgi:hypothetical protein